MPHFQIKILQKIFIYLSNITWNTATQLNITLFEDSQNFSSWKNPRTSHDSKWHSTCQPRSQPDRCNYVQAHWKDKHQRELSSANFCGCFISTGSQRSVCLALAVIATGLQRRGHLYLQMDAVVRHLWHMDGTCMLCVKMHPKYLVVQGMPHCTYRWSAIACS